LQSKDFSTNPSDYTAEELEILRNYEGAGGLTKLGEDTKGALDQFYTPDQVIDKMRELVQNSKGGIIESILEPSVGTGRFIAKAPPEARKT
jgi:type I restriction-modification system DNA methylase subunit